MIANLIQWQRLLLWHHSLNLFIINHRQCVVSNNIHYRQNQKNEKMCIVHIMWCLYDYEIKWIHLLPFEIIVVDWWWISMTGKPLHRYNSISQSSTFSSKYPSINKMAWHASPYKMHGSHRWTNNTNENDTIVK